MFRKSLTMRAPRKLKTIGSHIALAVALAAGSAVAVTPAYAQSDAPKYSKKFQKPAQTAANAVNAKRTSPEVDAEIQNLVAALNAVNTARTQGGDKAQRDAAVASAQAQVDAVSARLQQMTAAEKQQVIALTESASNADDNFFVGDQMDYLGRFTNDSELRIRGLQAKLQSGVLKPESVGKTWSDLGKLHYDAGRYEEAARAYTSAYENGMADEALFAAEAYFNANQVPQGLNFLKGVINARRAAGQPVSLGWVGTGVNEALDLNDINQIGEWTALYGMVGNSTEAWNAAINLLAGNMDVNLNSQDDLERSLDLYRLMKLTGAMQARNDYIGYLQAAMGRAGIAYPNEVVKIGSEAVAAGVLGNDDERITNARNLLADDQKSLPQLEKEGRAAATGDDAMAAADAYLSYGMNEKAEELYAVAQSKGVADANRLNMRLAIAQVGQQKYADALGNLAKVEGIRKPVASMWSAYIGTLTTPAAAAPAPAPAGV